MQFVAGQITQKQADTTVELISALRAPPTDFHWSYRSTSTCAMGLAYRLGMVADPGDMVWRSPLGMTRSAADCIFQLADFCMSKLDLSAVTSAVTAEDVARLLEEWLGVQTVSAEALRPYPSGAREAPSQYTVPASAWACGSLPDAQSFSSPPGQDGDTSPPRTFGVGLDPALREQDRTRTQWACGFSDSPLTHLLFVGSDSAAQHDNCQGITGALEDA